MSLSKSTSKPPSMDPLLSVCACVFAPFMQVETWGKVVKHLTKFFAYAPQVLKKQQVAAAVLLYPDLRKDGSN